MSSVFRYAIIRYRPFAETGEFANIGIVVLDTSQGELGFELAPRRFARVRQFFDVEAHDAYGAAIDLLRLELGRVSDYLPSLGLSGGKLFDEFLRRREGSVQYSEARPLSSAGSLEDVVRKLYGRYIQRDFVNERTPEDVLTRGIRMAFKREGIRHFRSMQIEDELVRVKFPFAYKGNTLFAIKPLAFGQKSPMNVLDYGAHWRKRFSYLLDRGKVKPGGVLLALERPATDAVHAMGEAYHLARMELDKLPFDVVETSSGAVDHQIIEFAERVGPDQRALYEPSH